MKKMMGKGGWVGWSELPFWFKAFAILGIIGGVSLALGVTIADAGEYVKNLRFGR